MTMFSQKPRFDLAEFLSKPPTTDAKRMAATDRLRRWQFVKHGAIPGMAPEPTEDEQGQT